MLLDNVGECLAMLNGMLKKRHFSSQSRERYRDAFGFPVIDYYRQIGFDFESESFDAVARPYHPGHGLHLPNCRRQCGAEQILRTAARMDYESQQIPFLDAASYDYRLARTPGVDCALLTSARQARPG